MNLVFKAMHAEKAVQSISDYGINSMGLSSDTEILVLIIWYNLVFLRSKSNVNSAIGYVWEATHHNKINTSWPSMRSVACVSYKYYYNNSSLFVFYYELSNIYNREIFPWLHFSIDIYQYNMNWYSVYAGPGCRILFGLL